MNAIEYREKNYREIKEGWLLLEGIVTDLRDAIKENKK